MKKIERLMCERIMGHKKLKRGNTRVEIINDEALVIMLHGNPIASVHYGNREVVLDHCGWQTTVTKNRLNAVCEALGLPCCVYQRNWIWYIQYGRNTIKFDKPFIIKI